MGEERRCTSNRCSPYLLLNFKTVLTDGKMNNIIILQHQKPCAFLQSIEEFKLATTFCHKSENWYLSKTISYVKCPFVPTFLLTIAEGAIQKTETFSLKDPFAWEFFVRI